MYSVQQCSQLDERLSADQHRPASATNRPGKLVFYHKLRLPNQPHFDISKHITYLRNRLTGH